MHVVTGIALRPGARRIRDLQNALIRPPSQSNAARKVGAVKLDATQSGQERNWRIKYAKP